MEFAEAFLPLLPDGIGTCLFFERRTSEEPTEKKKNLKQQQVPTTNSTHVRCQPWESHLGHNNEHSYHYAISTHPI